MNSLMNDAADGKLIPKSWLHLLAKKYEAIIDRKDVRIRELERGAPRQKKRSTETHAAASGAAAAGTNETSADASGADASGAAASGTADAAGTDDQPAQRKRGRPTSENQTERQQAEAADRKRQRSNLKMFSLCASMTVAAGGPLAFTLFFVYMLKCAVCHTNQRKKYIFVNGDVVKRILDDPELYAVFRKEIDNRRKPPITAFMHARLAGVSISAMDKLRFATIWTPGHSTLSDAVNALEKSIQEDWCPSGPVASWGTTRTEKEQTETGRTAPDSAEFEVSDADDAELEREVDAAMAEERDAASDTREASAANIERQALDLLRIEFPNASESELKDKWSGGLDASIDNEGSPCNVLQVVAVRAGILLGFIKVLITTKEVFIEEILVAEASRGMGLSWRLLGQVLANVKRRMLRLQVRKDNTHAIGLYEQGWLVGPWAERTTGNWAGCTPSNPDTHVLKEGTCAKTRTAIAAYLSVKQPPPTWN